MVKKKTDRISSKSNKKNKKPNPKVFTSYDDENREEWNKTRGEFEEVADELSKDHEFITLSDDSLRERLIKKNYPKQKDVKALVKRAIELYKARIKKFSI